MEYTAKTYDKVRAELSICTTDAHVMLHVTDAELSCEEQMAALCRATQTLMQEMTDWQPVLRRVFVSDSANQNHHVVNEWRGGAVATSVVEQPPLDGTKVAVWLWLMKHVECTSLPSGLFQVRQGCYRHLFSAGEFRTGADSHQQSERLLEDYAAQLLAEGLSLEANCARTWFFVQNVDCNYMGLVRARNEVFARHGLTPSTHFIASTGIGGRYADPQVSVLMDTYAVDGVAKNNIGYLYAPTHLNRTTEYGVSFERGAYIDFADRRQVLISGTASIDNRGNVQYPYDIRRQVKRMTENVEVLLAEAGCNWSHVQVIIIYLRDISDRRIVELYLQKHFAHIPHILTYARVCRSGWLVEMECMAIKN
ncbi:MAG: hypothetical protein HUK00_00895 [Bacteroidaceae bacterium]|nr:hypothetical protein [Bacteroidaceae bacterium]